jgi:hypothetical protein
MDAHCLRGRPRRLELHRSETEHAQLFTLAGSRNADLRVRAQRGGALVRPHPPAGDLARVLFGR